MEWQKIIDKFHAATFDSDGRLDSLPEEWQRELAALWRLVDVFNGGYLQFFHNWGHESYAYASAALKKIGADRPASIMDQCQCLIDEHFDLDARSPEEKVLLLSNRIVDNDGTLVKDVGSVLPDEIVDRITDLDYEFMSCPDDIELLGTNYYRMCLVKHGLAL